MLKGKIFNKEKQEIYRALKVDFEEKSIVCKKKNEIFKFSFSEIIWLECTYYISENGYIYDKDFVIAQKEEEFITGIVKKKNGRWFLINKIKGNNVSLKNLKAEGYKFINLKNASLYLKNKRKKLEK